ncbi:hypothetical protein CBR_g30356 [Chara braunii]|uniref:Uncharacterized protein n=1 Tax=Chara braunii TaxID=69332 RepID=A0A388JXG0_CHABU|nr:hypothetical protein CBR_g30356 [Chara braunii]|eukprot:GBG62403.1 hypothetical protein CBR_g30356 [Chara braunii]
MLVWRESIDIDMNVKSEDCTGNCIWSSLEVCITAKDPCYRTTKCADVKDLLGRTCSSSMSICVDSCEACRDCLIHAKKILNSEDQSKEGIKKTCESIGVPAEDPACYRFMEVLPKYNLTKDEKAFCRELSWCKGSDGSGVFGGDVVEKAGAGGGGGGLVVGVEESMVVEHAREEVSKGHVGFVGEGGCKVFVAYSFDAADERTVGNDGVGEVVSEGANVLDEAVRGTGLAEVAELFKVGVVCTVGVGVVCAVVTTVMEGVVPSIVVTRSHKDDTLAFMSSREAVTKVWKVLSAWRMAEGSGVAVFAGSCSPARLRAMLSTESVRMSDLLMEDAAMSGEEGVEDMA